MTEIKTVETRLTPAWKLLALALACVISLYGCGGGGGESDQVASDPVTNPTPAPSDPNDPPSNEQPSPTPTPEPAPSPVPEPTPEPGPSPEQPPVSGDELACSDGEQRLRFAVPAEGDSRNDSAAALANEINRRFNGRYCMELAVRAQFSDRDEWRQLGEPVGADFTVVDQRTLASPILKPDQSQYLLFDLPFLFEDGETLDRFLSTDVGRTTLADSNSSSGAKSLGYWRRPMSQLSADSSIEEPRDIAAKRIAAVDVVLPPFHDRFFESIGARSVYLGLFDVDTAVELRTIDGIEVRTDSYERLVLTPQIFDSITLTNHRVRVQVVVVAESVWESLPADVRVGIITIADNVSAENRKSAERTSSEATARLVQKGIVVRSLTPEQRLAWQRAARVVWQEAAAAGVVPASLIDAALISGGVDQSLLLGERIVPDPGADQPPGSGQPPGTDQPPVADPEIEQLLKARNCSACHAADRNLIGPSYQAIAARYRDDPSMTAAALAQRIMAGTVGEWGQIPMPENPQVSASEALTMSQWLLSR